MRTLIGLPIALVFAWFIGLYVAYGQVDPCRALAVEHARRAMGPTSLLEPLARLETSQMSTTACVRGLFHSWRERLAEPAD